MKHALEKAEPIFMSKAEFAKKAGVPLSVVSRLEKGKDYLVDTKGRKIFDVGHDLPSKRLIAIVD